MYNIKIYALLFLINLEINDNFYSKNEPFKIVRNNYFLITKLAFSYRLERQSDDLEINSTSIFTEEIAGLTDSNTYDSWKEWPDRLLFPRFHTSNDYKPSWTIITKSKTNLPSDSFYSSTFNSPHQTSSDLITSVYSSSSISSDLTSTTPNLTPTVSDYFSDSSSTYLQTNSNVLTSYPLQSSFKTDDLHATSIQDTNPTPSIDSSLFTATTSTIPQTTPSAPLTSEFSSDSNQFSSIDRTDDDTFSSINLDPSINPSSTVNLPEVTTSDGQILTTTPLSNDNKEYRHKTIIKFNQLPQGIENTTNGFEKKLKKVFELAYSRLERKNVTNLDIKIYNLDWSNFNTNKTFALEYSVQIDKTYLNNEKIEKLLKQLNEDEILKIMDRTYNQPDNPIKPDIKLSELLSRKIFDIDSPYFWIMICLFLLIIMICCFYLSALVCWIKHRKRSNTAEFLKERKDQISPISNYSSDTLNTDNFIRWRNRPQSTNVKQQPIQQNKREKSQSSLFKNDHKTGSLNKLKKRKEIGSSPSNEFEYISFTSSDTTNSSLQRDGSLNKRTQVRHHPYNQDYNKNVTLNKKDLNTSDYMDYQQDYQQDYHIPTIQKINQFNQPNSIKLLISRGVQSNLLPIEKQDNHLKDNLLNDNSSNNLIVNSKKFPLEIPSLNNSYYGNNVSVLNLSKEKLIPLTQYHTSDSSTTTTTNNTINNKNEFNNNRFRSIDSQNNRPNSGNSRLDSRPDSRISEPKRLIKKEIIEEFETTTTTTTFKNPVANPINKSTTTLDNLNKDLQLNEQTETIIKAIRDELSKFYSKPK